MRKGLLTALGAYASIFALTACSSPADAGTNTDAPASLIGEWYQVKSGFPDIQMTATVAHNSIQIDMKANDVTSAYWMGTFQTDGTPSGVLKIHSKGDPDAMKGSWFRSSEKDKEFSYKNGKLSFEFSIMGNRTTVYLAKDWKKPGRNTFTPTVKVPTPKATSKVVQPPPKVVAPAPKTTYKKY